MPLALLLSPDDQAVSAITAVLEEMSVTWERPLDGASAAQKLNSHSFDLVLVDCENLPAAKLIFDVCRRAKGNNNPVPIAIVDGRAGLPTAFRLGAELILTKPVAKDQARSTIRTAVGRVRKDEPAHTSAPTDLFNPLQADALPVSADQNGQAFVEPAAETAPEERCFAAAAEAGSSQLTSFSDPAPFGTPARPALTAPLGAPAAILDIETPAVAQAPALVTEPQPAAVMKPSDDPVLADLERTETETKANIPPPVLFPYSQVKPKKERRTRNEGSEAPKRRGPLVAVFVLVLAAAGLYAAWMYEPGFKALAQPQIDRVLAMVGVAHPQQPATSTPVKPVAEPAKIVPAPSADSSQGSQPGVASASEAGSVSATNSAALAVSSSSAPTPAPSTTGITTGAAGAPASPADKPGINQVKVAAAGQKSANPNAAGLNADKKNATAGSTDAELPGEKTAVILSSKGADRRLIHSVQPTYPAGVRPAEVQGTLVLKAVVDENGNVIGARVIEGNGALASAAISAVKQWRYRPYVREGIAHAFQTIVLVDFRRR